MTHFRFSHPVAFWLVTATTVAVMFASAVPAPIYPIYQQIWGFSSFTLTVIFAAYVAALLGSLLTVGAISDHVGRRPVIAGALIVLIMSMLLFMGADGVAILVTARVLQGFAIGAILATLSAAILDFEPNKRSGTMANGAAPGIGLSLGLAVTGVVVEYAPGPRFLIFSISLAMFVLLLIAVLAIPEIAAPVGFTSRRHVITTIAPRASVPPSVRGAFLANVPAMIATWSLGGLQLSLGSSIVERILGVHNHAAAGLILGAFFASAGLTSIVMANATAVTKLVTGYIGLISGATVLIVAYIESSAFIYLLGATIAGIGFGTTFVGIIDTISSITAPPDRSRVFVSVFLVCYAGFSAPALIAGMATERFGLRTTSIIYAIFVIVLTLTTVVTTLIVSNRKSAVIAGAKSIPRRASPNQVS